MKKASIVFFILIISLLFFGQSGFAETDMRIKGNNGDDKERIAAWSNILFGKTDVGIVPTSPFYFVKEWGRGIRKFFTFDPTKKAELELRYSDEKLLETAKVVDENCGESSGCNVKALEKAFNNYLSSQERLKKRLESLSKKNSNVSELVSKTTERIIFHQALFDELIFLAKSKHDMAMNAISNIKRVGSSGDEFEQVIKNFDEQAKKNKIDVIEGIGKLRMNKAELIDAIAKGAQATEKLPYSEGVKELKALEILNRIEEKLPEEAKKGIETAKENIEKRLLEEGKIQAVEEARRKDELQGGFVHSSQTGKIIIENIPLDVDTLEEILDRLEEKGGKPSPDSERPNIVNLEAIKELKTAVARIRKAGSQGDYFPAASNFKLEIDGAIQAEFKEISGIESGVEVIEYKDGDDLARKRPGRTKYSNVILKRGSVTDTKLHDWYERIAKGAKERKSGSVIVLDRTGQEVGRYNLFDAFPVKFEGGDYNVEEIEFKAEGGIIIGKKITPDKIESGSEQIRVPVACPLIAPDISKGKEECLKAAKHLDEIYPGCNYAKICEEISEQKPSLDCGPAPGAPGNWRCIDGAWKDISQCGKIQCIRYDPVCGTDGKTYSCGEIDAKSCGVEVAYKGECKKQEYPTPSLPGEQPAESSEKVPATKLPQPIACTQVWDPVCGSDGKTYSNECVAKSAGVTVKYKGECSAL